MDIQQITIAGGTGFLGTVLETYFTNKGYQVQILTREPTKSNHIHWNAKDLGKWQLVLEKTDVLINLTGKSVDCRYTPENKKRIYESRIDSTHLLGLAINLCESPPKLWINSSTATIYEGSYNREMTEETGTIGDDFSMNIAKSWEQAFYSITNLNTRKVAIRTSIVLGKSGGALIPLKKISKFGLGGKQGSGKQKVSWIHEHDFARAIEFLILNSELEGGFNLSVPRPINNRKLMLSLRKVLSMAFGLPQPTWLLKFGALLIGTEAELVLKSRNVVPDRLLKQGFQFKYTNIETALRQILKS